MAEGLKSVGSKQVFLSSLFERIICDNVISCPSEWDGPITEKTCHKDLESQLWLELQLT